MISDQSGDPATCRFPDERTASELGRVKSTLASVKDGAEIELNTLLAALTDAERNCVASQNTQDKTASELRERLFLEKVISELSAAHARCEETESQLRESRTALEHMKLDLVKAREASPSPLPKESHSIATPKLPGINGIPGSGEVEEESGQSLPSLTDVTAKPPTWPRKTTFLSDPMEASRQPVTPPVHPDSHAQRLRSTAAVRRFLATKTNK